MVAEAFSQPEITYTANPPTPPALEPVVEAAIEPSPELSLVFGSAADRFVVPALRVDDESVTPAVATIVSPPRPARPSSPPPVPADDDALIRRSIERFRVVYNARLDARTAARRAGVVGDVDRRAVMTIAVNRPSVSLRVLTQISWPRPPARVEEKFSSVPSNDSLGARFLSASRE